MTERICLRPQPPWVHHGGTWLGWRRSSSPKQRQIQSLHGARLPVDGDRGEQRWPLKPLFFHHIQSGLQGKEQG